MVKVFRSFFKFEMRLSLQQLMKWSMKFGWLSMIVNKAKNATIACWQR